MLSKYKNSITEAQRLLYLSRDVGHDLDHAKRVVQNARMIAEDLGYKDPDLIEVCAWWHDVGRLYQKDHEKLSAQMLAKDLKTRGVSYKTRRLAYKAVYKHRWDMEPSTIEGQIIKDADKLDFISVRRWSQRLAVGDWDANQNNLGRLPYVRKHLYFDISRRLFDQRLGRFAENLERPQTHRRRAVLTHAS